MWTWIVNEINCNEGKRLLLEGIEVTGSGPKPCHASENIKEGHMGTGSEGIQVQGPMSTWLVLALGQCVMCTAIVKVIWCKIFTLDHSLSV